MVVEKGTVEIMEYGFLLRFDSNYDTQLSNVTNQRSTNQQYCLSV